MIDYIKSEPWFFSVGIVIFVCAVVGLVYALVRRYGKGKDRGLMGDGRRHWPAADIPLRVAYLDNLPTVYIETFCQVMIEINECVGAMIFHLQMVCFGETDQKIHILLDDLIPNLPGQPGGTTLLHWDERTGKIMSAKVSFRLGLEGKRLLTVVRHETGHTLGLDHDLDPDSVMHASVHEDVEREYTDPDKALIKSLYGGG